jgi:hypothetical protein
MPAPTIQLCRKSTNRHRISYFSLGDNRRLFRLPFTAVVDIRSSLQPAQARRGWLGISRAK